MRIVLTWLLTVASVMPSLVAISLLLLPLTRSSRTSSSRELKSESGMLDAKARAAGGGRKRPPEWTRCKASIVDQSYFSKLHRFQPNLVGLLPQITSKFPLPSHFSFDHEAQDL